MLTSLIAALVAALPAGAPPLDGIPQTRLDASLRCLLGSYRLPAGKSVTITGVGGQPRGLQYTLSNGQFGPLREDADATYTAGTLTIRFAPCGTGTIRVTQDKVAEHSIRLDLIEKDTIFTSDGVTLHGKLVLPADGRATSAAVWIEGSNNDPSTDDAVWQYELARRGIAVFVYDKRGTGASAGALSSDIHARARYGGGGQNRAEACAGYPAGRGDRRQSGRLGRAAHRDLGPR